MDEFHHGTASRRARWTCYHVASDVRDLEEREPVIGRWYLLSCAGLVIVRMSIGAHAPAAVDAHVGLAAVTLGLVAQAPRPALHIAALAAAGASISVLSSWDPWISVLALPALLGPLAMFLLAASGACRAALLGGVTAGGALQGLTGVIQRFHTWPDAVRRMEELGLDADAVARLSAHRPIGLSVSPDLASGMCVAALFAAIATALEATERRIRWVSAMAALASIAGVLVFRSFGSALALAAGGMVAGLVLLLRQERGHARAVTLVAIGVAGAGLIAAVALRGLEALARSAGERFENWKAALAILGDAPLLGVGFMRFPAAYLAARSPEANITRYAHSSPLQLAAETGLVGGALIAAAALGLLVAVMKRARRETLPVRDVVLLGGAVAAAARMTVDYDGQVAQTASIAALLWGLLLASPTPAPAHAPQRRALSAAGVLSLVLVLILTGREHVLATDGTEAPDDRLIAWHEALPFDVEASLALGSRHVDRLAACTAPETCETARGAAHAVLDPLCARPHPPAAAFILRGRLHLLNQEAARARDDADAALRLHPGSESAHVLGIVAVRAMGADASAREEAARRWGVSPPPR